MSEDTDAKANRRRRTTRAGRRRAAGRTSSEPGDPGSRERWSAAWGSDPDTVPLDLVEESEQDVDATSDASIDGEGEGGCSAQLPYAEEERGQEAEDDSARPTGEIVVTPFSLELQDDEKTNPRIRVGDMGPDHPAELEPAAAPAVTIWRRPSRRSESEDAMVAVRPAVVITPSRVISDRPPPMHPEKADELVRSDVAVARAPAATPEAAQRASRSAFAHETPPRVPEPEHPVRPEPELPAHTSFEAFDGAPDSSAAAPAAPASELTVAAAASASDAARASPDEAAVQVPPAEASARPASPTPPPAATAVLDPSAAPVSAALPAAAPAAPAPPAPPATSTNAAASGAAPDASSAGAGSTSAAATPDEGGLQIVDVDVAELEHARRSRTPPPPPPDARSKAAPAKRPPPPPAPPNKSEEDRQKRKQARQWWERFFSDDYLMSVRPATATQIAKQVDFIEQTLGVAKGGTILDVGCGLGLHAVELTRRGYLVVGLDLSLAMITRAAELAQLHQLKLNVVHADIREMEFDGAFDGVICMGTTFGFFDDDANRDMLARLHQALRPGGRLLLDMVNRDYVIGFQPNLVWFEGDECVCMEESDFNYFNSRLTVKRTMMREDGKQSNAEYSVRLYSLHELGTFMQQVGFRVIEVSGQEAIRGAFFGANSPRVLMLAERRPLARPSAMIPLERNSAEQGRPPAAMPPERGSAEIPKIPKPE